MSFTVNKPLSDQKYHVREPSSKIKFQPILILRQTKVKGQKNKLNQTTIKTIT